MCDRSHTPEELEAAKLTIQRSVQRDAYPEEYAALQEKRAISNTSAILNLDPVMCNGLLRYGDVLNTTLSVEIKNPVILPKQKHVTKLLVIHYHEKVNHQGRQLTEDAVRAVGLWIVAGKNLISVINPVFSAKS